MNKIELSIEEVEYILNMTADVASFLKKHPDHTLASQDLEVLKDTVSNIGKSFIPEEDFIEILRDNVSQIEGSLMWSLTSENQVKIMSEIINKATK